MLSRLFIAGWERADPLGSCLWCLILFCHFPMWYPGSGVVLDSIDSWSLPAFLLYMLESSCQRARIILTFTTSSFLHYSKVTLLQSTLSNDWTKIALNRWITVEPSIPLRVSHSIMIPVLLYMGLDARNPIFKGVWTARAQTSLCVYAVWSAPLFFAYWTVSYLELLWAKFKFSS